MNPRVYFDSRESQHDDAMTGLIVEAERIETFEQEIEVIREGFISRKKQRTLAIQIDDGQTLPVPGAEFRSIWVSNGEGDADFNNKFGGNPKVSDIDRIPGGYVLEVVCQTDSRMPRGWEMEDGNADNLGDDRYLHDPTSEISGIGTHKARALSEQGIECIYDVQRLDQSELAEMHGIGNALAARMKADVGGTKKAGLGELFG